MNSLQLSVGDLKYGVQFDFDAPIWIEQGGDYEHGGGGTDVAEELAVDAAYGFPVFNVSEIHAGADYVLEGCAGFGESFFGDGEDAAGLSGRIHVVRANRACAG